MDLHFILLFIAVQNILNQIGLPNQITPQMISQMFSSTTAEQTNITQDQQQYVTQQPDMSVVEQLATSSTPTELINQVPSTCTSHTVVTSLQGTPLQDQYVQQADYQV